MPFVPVPSDVDHNLAFSLAQEVAAALARFIWFDVVAPTALMRGPAPTFPQRRRAASSGPRLCRQRYGVMQPRHVPDQRASARPQDRRGTGLDQHVRSAGGPAGSDRSSRSPPRSWRKLIPSFFTSRGTQKNAIDDDDALGCVMRALPLLNTMERENYEKARGLIERALVLEPDNAVVLSWAAYWHVFYIGQGWAQDFERTSKTALELCASRYAARSRQCRGARDLCAHSVIHQSRYRTCAALFRHGSATQPQSAVHLGL